MNAYAPLDSTSVYLVCFMFAGILASGFAVTRLQSRCAARLLSWALLPAGVYAVHQLTLREVPGFRMLALIGAGLLAMKAVVAVEAQASGSPPLSLPRWLCFALGWFGMRPQIFSGVRRGPLDGARRLITAGLENLFCGGVLIVLASVTWRTIGSRLAATALLLPGLSLVLHMGLFSLVTGLWRLYGMDCQRLFKAPLRAQNLTEFWGRRWNLAFSEMTALAVYRPLCATLGRRCASVVAFLFSGLLHEMAISLPVNAGFGLPLLYFAIHAVLVQFEAELSRRGQGLRGWVGRIWTLTCLLVPVPLLFHTAFLEGVIWPLIDITPFASP